VLHAQIEQLRAGRERLTETVHDVRRSVDAIAEDLFAAEDNARLAAENAGREAAGRPDEGTPEELAALLLAEEAEAASDVALPPLIDSGSPDETGPDEVDDGSTAGADPERDPGDDQGAESPVDALFAKIRAAREETEEEDQPSAAETDPDVRTPEAPATEPVADEPVAEPVAAEDGEGDDDGDESEDEPPEERNPLAVRRDELIEPIVTALARRLKRTLQDNQNELLDSLRSKGSDWSIQLLPTEIEHVDSYATAALPALEEAAQAGVSFAGSGSGPSTDVLIGVAHDLAESVVGPLRRRLIADDGALAGAEEPVVVEFVGSAFREWKGERIERLAGDHVVAAFSAGTLAALDGEASTGLEWVAVAAPGDEPCPDCEDNGLNGSQPAGDEFPTGHRHPPAHPGCRCLLTRSST
jgi:hypothetical protein